MKNYIKIYFVPLILAYSLLSGCSDSVKDPNEVFTTPLEECPISTVRTGTERQGINALENGFECTETGSYWMCIVGTKHWLLYSDHGSDTVIKLCGRPDCTHTDEDCNACLPHGVNVCYYEGYLYTYINDIDNGQEGLIRMNLDGTERLLVFDLGAFMEEQACRGLSSVTIRNGIFSFGLVKVDDEGNRISTSYYYKLDGSMESPARANVSVASLRVDGDSFLGTIGYDATENQYIYGAWDPETATTTEFFKSSEEFGTGYFGSEALYYIEDGVIYEYTYATGDKKALFDTGLKGEYQLSCFPDCIVVSEIPDGNLDAMTLRFYDWEFKDLGSVPIEYSLENVRISVICGETPDRIMLTTDVTNLLPRYYIDKSDFGTGEIVIHKYISDFD